MSAREVIERHGDSTDVFSGAPHRYHVAVGAVAHRTRLRWAGGAEEVTPARKALDKENEEVLTKKTTRA